MGLQTAFLTARAGSARLVIALLAVLLSAGLFAAGRSAADTALFDSVATSTLPSAAPAGSTWGVTASACGTGDQCVSGGYYRPSSGLPHAMLMPIANGLPGPAVAVTLPANAINAGSSDVLNVTCQDADSCTAVGDYTDSVNASVPMVVQITNGVPAAAVQILPPANALNTSDVEIEGVSCPSSGLCVAVGYYYTAASVFQGLVVPINNGAPGNSVAVTPPANVSASGADAKLNAVACQGSGACTAVGEYMSKSGDEVPMSVLISSGLPAAGTEGPVPADYRGNEDGAESFVACPASGACEALGSYTDSSGPAQYMVTPVSSGSFGTASGFTVTPTPHVTSNAYDVYWQGMSCSSASLCVASGYYQQALNQYADVTVPITPAGATAVVVAPAGAGDNQFGFYGVACLAGGQCLNAGFMGQADGSSYVYDPMQEQISVSGSVGASAATPPPSNANTTSPYTYLESVSCGAIGACVAIGTALDSAGGNEPYALSEQPAILITNTDPLPSATVGTPYTDTFTATGGWGPSSYTWSAAGLPAGVTLNAQTGVISGTPTVAGSTTVSFTVTGSGTPAPSETAHFLLVVEPEAPRIKLERTGTQVRRSRVVAKLLCGLATCKGVVKVERTVVVTVKKGKKRVRKHRTVLLGSARYKVAVDKTVSIKIALNARGRRALATAKRHRLSVKLVATVTGGLPFTRAEKIHSVAKKKKKHKKK